MNSESEGEKRAQRGAEGLAEPELPDSWCESDGSNSEAERALLLVQRREKKNRVSARSASIFQSFPFEKRSSDALTSRSSCAA